MKGISSFDCFGSLGFRSVFRVIAFLASSSLDPAHRTWVVLLHKYYFRSCRVEPKEGKSKRVIYLPEKVFGHALQLAVVYLHIPEPIPLRYLHLYEAAPTNRLGLDNHLGSL